MRPAVHSAVKSRDIYDAKSPIIRRALLVVLRIMGDTCVLAGIRNRIGARQVQVIREPLRRSTGRVRLALPEVGVLGFSTASSEQCILASVVPLCGRTERMLILVRVVALPSYGIRSSWLSTSISINVVVCFCRRIGALGPIARALGTFISVVA